jgi:predicted DNA-binding protein (UPF0251 family)
MPTVRVHHFPTNRQQPQVIREIIKEGPGLSQAEVLAIATKAVEIYAARHPRPTHVNLSQAAEMVGISRQTLSKILAFNRVKRNKLGSFPIEAIDRLLASND